MNEARWSLSTRMTRWVLGLTVGLAVAYLGLGAWFTRSAIEREIDALVDEEFAELGTMLDFAPAADPAEIASFVARLEHDHPTNPMAWRIRRGGELLGAFGPRPLLESLDRSADASERQGNVRSASRSTASGFELELALDVSHQVALLRAYRTVTLAFLGVTILVALGAGALLRRLVGGQLRTIAQRIRDREDVLEDSVDTEGLPDEVRAVALALADLLQRIRTQAQRSELLTAGTAHELRSPLQNLLGETEIALLRDRSVEEYQATLRGHHEELRRLVRAVDNLVTLCSTSQRVGAIPREEFDYGEEIHLRLSPEYANAARRSIELAVHTSGDVRVVGDREALTLVVRNLVGNALEWTPPESRVEVRVSGRQNEVRVVVDDEGPGVAPDDRERIFEPFRSVATPDDRRAGYGLGLALARAAVEAHRGSISVDSSPSGGARFVVVIPRDGAVGDADQASTPQHVGSTTEAITVS